MAEVPTRALSLIQPWAWCVIYGPKDIENRTWWSTLRGPLWIAASAQVTRRYYDQAKELIESIAPGLVVPALKDLDYGCIIGRATITDVILPGGYRWTGHITRTRAPGHCYRPERGGLHPAAVSRWYFPEQYGYVLADRTALVKPVPCKGLQRLWTVPEDVLEQLRGVVAA